MSREKGFERVRVLSEGEAVGMLRKALANARYIEFVASRLRSTDSWKGLKIERIAQNIRLVVRDLESVL